MNCQDSFSQKNKEKFSMSFATFLNGAFRLILMNLKISRRLFEISFPQKMGHDISCMSSVCIKCHALFFFFFLGK